VNLLHLTSLKADKGMGLTVFFFKFWCLCLITAFLLFEIILIETVQLESPNSINLSLLMSFF